MSYKAADRSPRPVSGLTPTMLLLAHSILKPEKPAFVLPVTYQTQQAETGIGSLWVLYSDGQQCKKMVGLYPNRPSYIPFQTAPFHKEKKSVGKRFGIQGKIQSDKSCSILSSVS